MQGATNTRPMLLIVITETVRRVRRATALPFWGALLAASVLLPYAGVARDGSASSVVSLAAVLIVFVLFWVRFVPTHRFLAGLRQGHGLDERPRALPGERLPQVLLAGLVLALSPMLWSGPVNAFAQYLVATRPATATVTDCSGGTKDPSCEGWWVVDGHTYRGVLPTTAPPGHRLALQVRRDEPAKAFRAPDSRNTAGWAAMGVVLVAADAAAAVELFRRGRWLGALVDDRAAPTNRPAARTGPGERV